MTAIKNPINWLVVTSNPPFLLNLFIITFQQKQINKSFQNKFPNTSEVKTNKAITAINAVIV